MNWLYGEMNIVGIEVLNIGQHNLRGVYPNDHMEMKTKGFPIP